MHKMQVRIPIYATRMQTVVGIASLTVLVWLLLLLIASAAPGGACPWRTATSGGAERTAFSVYCKLGWDPAGRPPPLAVETESVC